MQKTVPKAIHTSNVEKATWTGPISNSTIDRATVSSTNAMVRDRRLELEKKVRSN